MTKQSKKSSRVLLIVLLLLLGGGLLTGFFMYTSSQKTVTVQKAMNDDEMLKQMAAEIADGWNIPDLTYDITIQNRAGDYARVVVTPTNQMLDPLQIIFKKENGTWTYVNMGTSFPDLEQEMPELFR